MILSLSRKDVFLVLDLRFVLVELALGIRVMQVLNEGEIQ